MKWIGISNLGMLLLAVWLIATGVLVLVPITGIPTVPILAGLAIAAGILILLGR
ncbi:MAG: hypothetical protein SGJ20_22005 [Planctomycetota bacterium]|nr:hypothetical protein [Planctomycetota bacterium]